MQLIVLGMHRSGATCLTGLLEKMGAHVGAESALATPDPADPGPSWERRELRALCTALLAELSSDGWQSGGPRLDELSQPARERMERCFATLVEELDRRQPWVIKEPRLCLLHPLIAPLLERPLCIHVWRHPVEVARSLRARVGTPASVGLALWELYNARALEASRGVPRVVVSHRELMLEPVRAVERLHRELLEAGETGLRPLAEGEIRSLVDPERWRQRLVADLAGVDPSVELARPAVLRMWRALEDRSVLDPGQRFHASPGTLEELSDHESVRRNADTQIDEWKDRFRESNAREASSGQLEAAHARLELERALDAARAELGAAAEKIAAGEKHRARIAGLEQKVARVQDELHAILWSRRYRVGSAIAEVCHRLFPRFVWRLAESCLRRLRPLYRRLRGKAYEPVLPASMSGLVLTPRDAGRSARPLSPRPRVRPILPHPGFEGAVDPAVTVIVPIFNAADETRQCVAALLRNLAYPAELLLIDDASTDPRIAELFGELAAVSGVRVTRNPRNLGYTATINLGIASCRGDVVLLNSDTEVGPRWLENLILAAYSRDHVATVTALSDNAGAFSVPEPNQKNELPRQLSFDAAARLVMQDSARTLPAGPTGSGFCMYVRRAAIAEIGPFDVQRFPRGYGEENDFCMRALGRGWTNLVDDRTLVRHARSRSFGKEKEALLEQGRRVLIELHPDYGSSVRAFLESEPMKRVRENLRTAFGRVARGERRPRPRVLFVIHEGSGGTAETNRDLMQELERDYECLLLSSNGRALELSLFEGGARVALETVRLAAAVSVATLTSEEYRDAVARILVERAIELVHVRHLFGHTLDLPEVASGLNVPVIASLHDYYYVCPTINLLDERDRYCAGRCTSGEGTCRIPTRWIENLPPLKHRYVYTWRKEVERRVLARVDACVATTRSAQEVFLDVFPRLREKRFEVIEHGRDLEQLRLAVAPSAERPLRVLILGNLTAIKGGGFVAGIREHDLERRIEFHVLGQCHREYADLAVQHGPYERDDLFRRIGEIGPNVVGLFSIWAETYSHTLTEAWAAGIPVVATDLGAFRERIRAHGGGWLVDPADPERACELLLSLASDTSAWRREAERAVLGAPRRVSDMSTDYHSLYQSILSGRRSLRSASAVLVGSQPTP